MEACLCGWLPASQAANKMTKGERIHVPVDLDDIIKCEIRKGLQKLVDSTWIPSTSRSTCRS